MTSQLKVDKLQGRTTAGSITVTSEGTSVETNLQQGLLKAWLNFNGTGTVATRDSFNITGITDNGTGNYSITIANDMANDTYIVVTNGARNEDGVHGVRDGEMTTTLYKCLVHAYDGSTDFDSDSVYTGVAGDLA